MFDIDKIRAGCETACLIPYSSCLFFKLFHSRGTCQTETRARRAEHAQLPDQTSTQMTRRHTTGRGTQIARQPISVYTRGEREQKKNDDEADGTDRGKQASPQQQQKKKGLVKNKQSNKSSKLPTSSESLFSRSLLNDTE